MAKEAALCLTYFFKKLPIKVFDKKRRRQERLHGRESEAHWPRRARQLHCRFILDLKRQLEREAFLNIGCPLFLFLYEKKKIN